MSKTLLRRIYKGTSREHHKRLNFHTAIFLLGIAIAVFLSSHDLAVFSMYFGCLIQEDWARPDRDEQEHCNIRGYWGWYGDWVKHRNRWSHSLLFGTPARLAYGYWFATPTAIVWPIPAMWFVAGAIAADCAHYALDINKHWGVKDAIFGKK